MSVLNLSRKTNSNLHPLISYGDTLNRNNLSMAQNNSFNTLGRNHRNNINNHHSHHNGNGGGGPTHAEIVTNTLGRNNRYTDVPVSNPLFHIR